MYVFWNRHLVVISKQVYPISMKKNLLLFSNIVYRTRAKWFLWKFVREGWDSVCCPCFHGSYHTHNLFHSFDYILLQTAQRSQEKKVIITLFWIAILNDSEKLHLEYMSLKLCFGEPQYLVASMLDCCPKYMAWSWFRLHTRAQMKTWSWNLGIKLASSLKRVPRKTSGKVKVAGPILTLIHQVLIVL